MTRGLVMSVALALPVSLAGCGSAPPTDKSGTATPMNKLGTAAPTNQSDDGTEPAPKSRFADVPIPEEPAVEFVVLDPALATSKAAEIPTQELSEMDGKVVDEVVPKGCEMWRGRAPRNEGRARSRLVALGGVFGGPID
jgi:hypothetical protein